MNIQTVLGLVVQGQQFSSVTLPQMTCFPAWHTKNPVTGGHWTTCEHSYVQAQCLQKQSYGDSTFPTTLHEMVFMRRGSANTGDMSLANPSLVRSKTIGNIAAWYLMNFASFNFPTAYCSLWPVEFPASLPQQWGPQVKKLLLESSISTKPGEEKEYTKSSYYDTVKGRVIIERAPQWMKTWQNRLHPQWASENTITNMVQ